MKLKFIDLFAGMGGIRKGLELAAIEKGITTECVFTSEIKPAAIKVLKQNHPDETINGDITKIEAKDIPDFDILLGGFPCQAFSTAGQRRGFADTRGTLFFDVARIIKEKQPKGFILENVEGLVSHDKGRTFMTIINTLNEIGYSANYRILNSKDFGIAQERKRIYIVGINKKYNKTVNLDYFDRNISVLKDILETNMPTSTSPFIKNLLSHFSVEELYGKSIKDKRGGEDNIHSWELGIKGETSKKEQLFLNTLMRERRKKKWAEMIGIEWMDGMALNKEQIKTFYHDDDLDNILEHLTNLGYLKYEYPKKKVTITTEEGVTTSSREYDTTKQKGYNIVSGKLSFEVNKILDPNSIAPTLVAMDMSKLYVPDNGGIRKLTHKEGLRLFGYPEDFKFDVTEKEGYDLLGNTVVVSVIKAVATRLLEEII